MTKFYPPLPQFDQAPQTPQDQTTPQANNDVEDGCVQVVQKNLKANKVVIVQKAQANKPSTFVVLARSKPMALAM